jgi:hypothetical protein
MKSPIMLRISIRWDMINGLIFKKINGNAVIVEDLLYSITMNVSIVIKIISLKRWIKRG